MTTTIQISNELKQTLSKRKLYKKETYEEVIWDLIEDTMELSEQTKKNMEISKEQIKRGEFKTLEEVKKELRL
ncbi:enoyl-CoA hydratase/isomerase family protein [Candidatus Woesearchaeota archaeon]|nr:enoyl-CoA hydratase/isomerase family protein [Candidatus Woesearchaeota archaeon]